MPLILLVGPDEGVLEGVAQMLAAAGLRASTATDLAEALVVANERAPLVLVVERSLAVHVSTLASRLKPGGAVIVYRTDGEATPLLGSERRLVLAELTLPLERQRLLALAQSLAARVRATGRSKLDTPPERPHY